MSSSSAIHVCIGIGAWYVFRLVRFCDFDFSTQIHSTISTGVRSTVSLGLGSRCCLFGFCVLFDRKISGHLCYFSHWFCTQELLYLTFCLCKQQSERASTYFRLYLSWTKGHRYCTLSEFPRCHSPTSRLANTFLASHNTSSLTPRLGQYLLLVAHISLQYSKTIAESPGILRTGFVRKKQYMSWNRFRKLDG